MAATTSTIQALSAAMAKMTDPVNRKVLAEQIEFAARGAQASEQTAVVPPSEAVRRAEGAWKDAKQKHVQASAAVSRCQENLVVAMRKEEEAARTLALAEISKRAAAVALAREAGVDVHTAGCAGGGSTSGAGAGGADVEQVPMMNVTWE